MYEYRGLQDMFFMMLYGGAAFFALLACLYLLLRRGNAFADDVKSSLVLRRGTAAFMAAVVASHVWWVLLGQHFLVDDRLVRNIIAISLDYLTFVPLMMCVLLRMLQDRRRPLCNLFALLLLFLYVALCCASYSRLLIRRHILDQQLQGQNTCQETASFLACSPCCKNRNQALFSSALRSFRRSLSTLFSRKPSSMTVYI